MTTLQRRSITEAEVFAALPEDDASFLTQYVWYASTQSGSPAAFHIGVGLSLLTLTAPRMFCASRGFLAPTLPNFWTFLVGRSGEAQKNLALRSARELITAAELDEMLGDDPASEEQYIKGLARKPKQLLIDDDMGSFLANVAQRGGYRGAIADSMTRRFDGDTYIRERTSTQYPVIEPRFSFLAAGTPVHLEYYTSPTQWEGGFMSRFLILFANSERDVRFPEEDPARFDWLLNRLVLQSEACAWHDSVAAPEDGRRWWRSGDAPAGRCRGMDADADAFWEAWWYRIRSRTRALPDNLAGVGSRTPLMAAKICTLLSWDRLVREGGVGQDWEIGLDDVRCAVNLAELSLRSALDLSRRISPTEDGRFKRMVYGAVGLEWTPVALVYQNSSLLHKRADACLATLEAEGLIEKTSVGPGRTKQHYWRRTTQQLPGDAVADESDEIIAGLGQVTPGPWPGSRSQAAPAYAEDYDEE